MPLLVAFLVAFEAFTTSLEMCDDGDGDDDFDCDV